MTIHIYVRSSTNSKCINNWRSIEPYEVCTGSYLNIDTNENRRFLGTLNVLFFDEYFSGPLYVRSDGYGIGWSYIDFEIFIRPVVHLKADIKLMGDGTSDSPYKIIS